MNKIIYQNEQWIVYQNSDISCKRHLYEIDWQTLKNTDWIQHMEVKNWVDMDLFKKAFDVALNNLNKIL